MNMAHNRANYKSLQASDDLPYVNVFSLPTHWDKDNWSKDCFHVMRITSVREDDGRAESELQLILRTGLVILPYNSAMHRCALKGIDGRCNGGVQRARNVGARCREKWGREDGMEGEVMLS